MSEEDALRACKGRVIKSLEYKDPEESVLVLTTHDGLVFEIVAMDDEHIEPWLHIEQVRG